MLAKSLNRYSEIKVIHETRIGSVWLDKDWSEVRLIREFAEAWWNADIKGDLLEMLNWPVPKGRVELLLAFLEFYKKDSGLIIGEKTPRHIFIANEALMKSSSLKVIHLLRNPVNVARSYRSISIGPYGYKSIANLLNSVWEIHSTLENNPRYYLVHYEDLINDSTQISALADWLGVQEHTFDSVNDYKALPSQSHMLNLDRKGFEKIRDITDITEQEKMFIGCLSDGLIKHYNLENQLVRPSRFWIIRSILIEWLNKALIRYPIRILKHGL